MLMQHFRRRALECHPLSNRANPRSSNKALFWVWDFAQRTRNNLNQINMPALMAKDPRSVEELTDAIGRTQMCRMMICDQTGNMLRMMTMGAAPVNFREVAREKAEIAADNCGQSFRGT